MMEDFLEAVAVLWLCSAMACSSAVQGSTGDGGTRDGHAAMTDTSRPGRDAAVDAGVDAGEPASGDAGSGSDAPPQIGCHQTKSSFECIYSSSNAPGFACSSVDASVPGSCASHGLTGCCVLTNPPDGGVTTISATCYYADAGLQQTLCENEFYEGFPAQWGTTAP